ncbi:uncharacterized protein [Drosophila virilis]|uniref:Uncharacterized protein n=1 Tax=Drosophila virilis TaxID=7244 RepID=B4LL67_DROVI|nr:uncharacterized protein LOC6626055 [Drosophila virilis]EDW60804.1 uncharacterized protein Dvir_GJ20660 [Drosophila virilis]
MKFYPNADVWFYVDKPGCWGKYQKYAPHHSWKLPIRPFTPKVMYHWRDFDGVKMAEITRKDLYFDKWPTSRIRPQACLGMLYATGHRFIKLSMAPPAGFKCAPLPVNLVTAKYVKSHLRKLKRQAKLAKKKEKKAKKAAKKAAEKLKNRGARRGRQ